jgi:hypothetical protein
VILDLIASLLRTADQCKAKKVMMMMMMMRVMMMMILIEAMHGDRMSHPLSLPNNTMKNALALMTQKISQYLTRPSCPKN